MTIQEVFNNFILSRRLEDLSKRSIEAYEQFISPFVKYCGKENDLETITQEHINKYIETLLTRPLSKSTRATYIRHIKIFLKWAESEYTVQYKTKSIKVPKSPKKNVRIYSDNEVKTIFEAVTQGNEWLTMRNKCIIALMYDSGLRQSEVCTLLRKRISFADERIVVHGKGDKERTVPLGKLTAQLIQAYIKMCPYESEFLFVNRHGETLTCNAVKLLITKLANQLPFELSSHKLRHNFATNYCINQYEKNGNVDIYRLMYIMGHEDIETTKRYLHFAMEIIATKGCISQLDKLMYLEN